MTITERYKKPDHPGWAKVGKIAVEIAQPVGVLAIMIFAPAAYKEYAVAAWIGVCNAIKGATKLTTNNIQNG